jgi:hypothetical protein
VAGLRRHEARREDLNPARREVAPGDHRIPRMGYTGRPARYPTLRSSRPAGESRRDRASNPTITSRASGFRCTRRGKIFSAWSSAIHRIVMASPQPGQRPAVVHPVHGLTIAERVGLGAQTFSEGGGVPMVASLQRHVKAPEPGIRGTKAHPVGVALPGALGQLSGILQWSIHIAGALVGYGYQ